jgi:DNA polymerase-3 subunit beta
MKFNIPSKLLLTHLSAVSKVVNSKNAISILDNFLFALDGEKLVVTGSDQETTLTTNVAVSEAEGSGKFAVNVKNLLDLLKELPDQPLTFEINDDNFEINIFYQNGKFNFIGINGDEFPQKEASIEETLSFSIPAEEVIKGISHSIFAVGTEDLRPVMMGILWDIKPDEITFVASDTHKLVRYRDMRVKPGMETNFILPTKPANILSTILVKEEGDVAITLDPKSATFVTGEYTLNCRFVNGKYPNYNSVIPKDNPYKVVIDRVSLLNAIRRVSVFASVGGLVKIEVRANELYLKAQDVDFSTWAEETVPCEYTGEQMTIGFNDDKIIEILNNIEADTVDVQLSDPSRPGIFVPSAQEEGEDYLALLMPMML